MNVLLIDDDVTDVDADAKLDALILRHIGISNGHATIDFHGAAHGVDDTCEFDQHSVARRLDDAAVMLLNLRVDQLAPMRLQCRPRADFVGAHRRLYPATSAARIAASLRSTRRFSNGASGLWTPSCRDNRAISRSPALPSPPPLGCSQFIIIILVAAVTIRLRLVRGLRGYGGASFRVVKNGIAAL